MPSRGSRSGEIVSGTIEHLRKNKAAPRISPGMERVLSLPSNNVIVPDRTEVYALPGSAYRLREIQSKALYHMRLCGGLIAPIGVGHGKFLISALAGTALEAQRPLLLVPPALVKQTQKEIEHFRHHFKVPENLKVMSYGMLSVESGSRMLDYIAPDLIIADECHHLRHRTAARTKRVIRYIKNSPQTKFVALSGTLTAKSILDYAHLVELALREKSPIPLSYWELQSWASCIDVGGEPDQYDLLCLQPLRQKYGGTPRHAYYRRFESSMGVVATQRSAVACSLHIVQQELELPESISKALKDLEKTWTTPGGEEIEDALAMARYRQQILCGFYYEWEWPEGRVDWQWLDARAEWHRQVRRVLKRSLEGKDSPLLVARWAQSDNCFDTQLIRAWEAWDEVRDRKHPPVKTRWIDEYMVEGCMQFLDNNEPTIIWCKHKALLSAFERRGLPVYGAGVEIPDLPAHHCAMSMKAHGTGKNLQRWAQNLLTVFPGNGSTIEQLIGRTHRPGQAEDEVCVHYFKQHPSVKNDIRKAKEGARYIEETQGNRMKILYATWI